VAVVVARYLTPREFGLAAMALVIAGIASLTTGFGTDVALVQQKDASDEDRSSVFWSLLAAGILCTAAGAALAPAAAAWFHDSRVTLLFAVAALTFILSALSATHRAIMTRELRFAALETGTIAAGIAGSAVVVAGVVAGLGAWALVVQQLTTFSVLAVASWIQCPWRPARRFSYGRLRLLAPVSMDVFVTRLSLGAARLVDNVIIGRFLGSAALGLYSLAYNVMLLPSSRLTGPVQDVLYPVFARLADERARLLAIWQRSTRAIVLLVAPLGIVVVATAPELVRAVFGARWAAAAPLVRILAVAGVLQALSTGNLRILVALGRSRSAARFGAAWLAAVVAAVATAVHWGILWVSVAYTCATAVFTPILFAIVAGAFAVGPRVVLAPFLAAVAPASAMAATTATVLLATNGGAPAAAAAAAAGLLAYGATFLGGFRRRRPLRLEADKPG
jgi:O-antigen/teichoic acid export membrane protein